jgi:hypothetical protein
LCRETLPRAETPHRERPGTDYRPGRSIDWSVTNARAPSPFSRGRRTGRGDGTGLIHLVPDLFYPSFSPLSRGETWGQAPCFVSERGAHPAAAAGKTTPVVPTRSEGAGGVGGDDSPTGCADHDSRPHDPRFTIHDSRSTIHNSRSTTPNPHVDADASPLPMH